MIQGTFSFSILIVKTNEGEGGAYLHNLSKKITLHRMAYTTNIITHKDNRTGKTYFCHSEMDEKALERMLSLAEYDYQQTLSPEVRAKKLETDFKCPHCKSHEEPGMRKMSRSILFSSWLEDIHRCKECDKEFTKRELDDAVAKAYLENEIAIAIERVKSGEITHDEFDGMIRCKTVCP